MTICYLGILSILKSIHNLYVPLSICTTTQNLLRATTIDNFFFVIINPLLRTIQKTHLRFWNDLHSHNFSLQGAFFTLSATSMTKMPPAHLLAKLKLGAKVLAITKVLIQLSFACFYSTIPGCRALFRRRLHARPEPPLDCRHYRLRRRRRG